MIEETPVGGGSAQAMDEFASSGPVEVDTRPLNERIGDKNWKTRLTAYEDLKREIKSSLGEDPLFSEYASWLPKMTSDAHPGALDTGIDTALDFIEVDPGNQFKPFAEKIASNIVDKSFGARPATQAKGKAVLLKMIEVDDASSVTSVLIAKLTDKKPKVPPTCLETIKDGVTLFGARAFPIKEIIASLPAILNGSNAPARELALSLMGELVRWIGKAPFNTLLENIRDAQKADFEKICTERASEGKPVPTLWLRKDRPAAGGVSSTAESVNLLGKSVGACSLTDDGREFIEDVDIAKKLKGTEYATLVAEEKWEPQLRAMQMIIDALGPTPKIKPGSDLHEYMGAIKGFLRQGHITVQIASMKILGLFADGLRGEFSGLARSVSQLVILKCKEKKLCDPLVTTLMSFMRFCLNFESFYEDFNEQIRNKKCPSYSKTTLLEFIQSGLQELPEKFSTEQLKPVTDMVISCAEDSDPKVREVCAQVLVLMGPIVKSRGRAAIDAHKALTGLEQSNPRLYKKVQAALDATAAPTAMAAAAAPAVVPKKVSSETKDDAPAIVKTKSSLPPKPSTSAAPAASMNSAPARPTLASAAAAPKPVAAKPSSGGGAKKASADEEDDTVAEIEMSLDVAKDILSGLNIENWATSFQELATSAKWQEKVDALGVVSQAIQSQEAGGQFSAALVVYLQGTNSNFKISNINILKAVIQTACAAAQFVGTTKFNKSAAWILLREFGDKLSDKKTSGLVCSLLTGLAEAINPSYVVKRMKHVLDKVKAPAAHETFLQWMKDAIREFGANLFPIAYLGNFCQIEMDNRDGKVRTAAIEVMGALYNQIGPKLQSVAFSDDMKPALKAVLEAEFTKVGYDPSIRATRGVKGEADASDGGSSGGGLPRQDLATLLDKNIITEMNLVEGKTSWQNRKTAIEAVISCCEKSGHYLDATKGTVEIVKALKSRLADTNANLKPIAANAISHVVASLEPDSGSKLLRAVASALVSTLGDNKPQMRLTTVSSLQMMVTLGKDCSTGGTTQFPVDANLLNVLVPPLGEILGVNPVGRLEILTWLNIHADLIKGVVSPTENIATELTVPLVNAMQDKTAAVRSLAEQLLSSLMARGVISRAILDKATRDLPPATKRSLQPSIDRMNSIFGTKKADGAPSSTVSAVSAMPTATTAPSLPPASVVTQKVVPAATKPAVSSVPSSKVPPAIAAEPTSGGAAVEGSGQFALKKTTKQKRCDDFYKTHWPQPPSEVGDAEMVLLKQQWEPFISNDSDLMSLLFPVAKAGQFLNQDNLIPCMAELTAQLDGPYFIQHSDFLLRWATYALCARETATGLLKVLQFITQLFEKLRCEKQVLHEAEMNIVIPHLVDKSGHKSERHKLAFNAALKAVGEIVPPNKLCQFLLQGLTCKNKKTRVVCIEEIQRVVEEAGVGSLGRAGVREIALYLDSKDNDVSGRHACLDLCFVLFTSLGNDQGKLTKLLGDISERSAAMVEERIRQKMKGVSTTAPAPAVVISSSIPSAVTVAAVVPKIAPNVSLSPKKSPSVAANNTNVSTPDFKNDTSFLYEQSPFKLEMTPPGHVNVRTSMHDVGVVSSASDVQLLSKSAPVVLPKRLSTSAKMAPVFDGIYADIATKLNTLLEIPHTVEDSCEAHDDAREYLKMLHLVVTGAWAKETLPEDEEALTTQAEGMVALLLKCLDRSFVLPSISTISQQALLGVDLSLASLTLANLYAFLSRDSVVYVLSEECVVSIFGHCVERLIDTKLKYAIPDDPNSPHEIVDESDFGFSRSLSDMTMVDTAQQLIRVMNILILRLAQQAPTGLVFGSLLKLIKGCIPELVDDACSGVKRIAPPGSKVLSRLILRVVSDEVARINSFQRSSTMLKTILYSLHCFFDNHPEVTVDEIPFCTAKTLLDQVIKSVGSNQIVHAINALSMEAHCSVPKTSLLAKLIGKYVSSSTQSIGLVSDGTDVYTDTLLSPSYPTQHQEIVTIIDNITSARDKSIPIKRLHDLLHANPGIDVHQYLQRISSAFRKFVIDALSKLDDGGKVGSAISGVSRSSALPISGEFHDTKISLDKSLNSDDAVMVPSSNLSSSIGMMSDISGGSEAMRIIEGLKRNKSELPHVNESSTEPTLRISKPLSQVTDNIMKSPTSRSQINEKIRGSLNSLTASLDLSTSSTGTSASGVTGFPTTNAGDGDLAARLARLRMNISAPAGTATIMSSTEAPVSDSEMA